ncbi:YdeI/OmpD-associated family protein [Winogradskyella sp. 3972H.M.0a.05]|uniref:YdeI/OmpD-associated family protein n=1 Tax=Winogradskyella sp. 3972H.M.0a.05 TaxID=2950277 RepID=UPI0033990A6B
MKESNIFETTIKGIHSLPIPEDIGKLFYSGGKTRVKIKATFEGNTIEFHAALNRRKDGSFSIMFGKDNQKKLGVFPNDYFQLQLFEDQSKYGVEMPEELEAVLMSDYEGYQIFENLTPGKQRTIIYAILRYKTPQTRVDKALLVIENLKRGVTNTMDFFKSF